MARNLAFIFFFALALTSSRLGLALERHSQLGFEVGHQDGNPNGSAAELVQLAVHYENGEGVPQSFDRARELYCEAADLNVPGAFFGLGWIFLNGRGVARDEAIAASWFKKAADRGIQQASNILQLMPNVTTSHQSGCPVAPSITAPAEIQKLVVMTSQKVGVNPRLVLAVIAVESAFNPRAVSPKNARGLMQLMPETAARFGVRDPFDMNENVRGGVTYLHDLLLLFRGNLRLALAAYNAGEAVVLSKGDVPPYDETRYYVERITRLCACEE